MLRAMFARSVLALAVVISVTAGGLKGQGLQEIAVAPADLGFTQVPGALESFALFDRGGQSYYAVSLCMYLFAPAAEMLGMSKTALGAAVTLPVLAAVSYMVSRIRKRLH